MHECPVGREAAACAGDAALVGELGRCCRSTVPSGKRPSGRVHAETALPCAEMWTLVPPQTQKALSSPERAPAVTPGDPLRVGGVDSGVQRGGGLSSGCRADQGFGQVGGGLPWAERWPPMSNSPGACDCDLVWKWGVCRCHQVKMRPWWTRLSPEANGTGPYKKKIWAQIHREKPREDRGRAWREEDPGKRNCGERPGWDAPSQPRGSRPCRRLDLPLLDFAQNWEKTRFC